MAKPTLGEATSEFESQLKDEQFRFELRNSSKPLIGSDKAIPKITKFQNKLRKFTLLDLGSIKKDLLLLDLSKYATELAECLLESALNGVLKLKDVGAASELCSILGKSYGAEFSDSLERALCKMWKGNEQDLGKRPFNKLSL